MTERRTTEHRTAKHRERATGGRAPGTMPAGSAPPRAPARRSATPPGPAIADRFARVCSTGDDRCGAPSAMVVVAHPDDETVGAGALLGRLDDVVVVHVTDGAPRDLADARSAGFTTREAYARARRDERDAALALVRIAPDRIHDLCVVDQEASLSLGELPARIAELLRASTPDLVITHPYEGGHPDHDATAFAVHAALALLRRDGASRPLLLEQTSYFNSAGTMATYEFLPTSTAEPLTLTLAPAERALKHRMLEQYVTQRRVLAPFPVAVERFRAAPAYDFTRPPHDGIRWYEIFSWGMTGDRFAQLAREALGALGLERPGHARAPRAGARPTAEPAAHHGGSGGQPAGSGHLGGAAPELLVDEVTTCDGLEGLCEEWHQLLDRCPWATPFQSPEWLLSWWRAMGGGELCVTTLRRDGRLVGLAPLFIYCGPDGRRRLAMLGAGISDYEDVLLEPELADAGAALLLRHIAEERSRWDAGEFLELRAASPLLAAPCPPELSVERYPSSSCTVLSLPATVDALPASLSWRFRRRLRNARNRLGRAGDAQFVTADERSLPELLEALVRLHSLRWEERGEPGVLSDPRLRRFHQVAAAGFLRRGWLRLHALRLRGAPIAVLHGFAHRDRACMYLSGLDPSADFCSPGVLILQYAIEQAIHEGARELDMLRGTESYKYEWSAERRPNAGLRLRHAGAAGDRPAR